MSIFTRAFNKLGGYDDLAARYPGGPEPDGPRWERQCVQFGRSVRYDWCVTFVLTQAGLWLQARPPAQGAQSAIFLPWAEIGQVQPVRLYWRRAVRLACGEPQAGAVTIFEPIWDAAGPLWQAAGAAGR